VRKLRSALILLTFVIFTLPLMPVQLGLRIIAPRLARRFPHWYHRQVCRILGVTIHCHGTVAEDRPVLLVSNHISWLDIIVLSAVAPVSFVAKSEVGTWPFISWLAKLQGTIFINRNDRLSAGDSAREIMADFAGDSLDYFVSGYGTGGTVTGVARVLRKERPDTKIILSEPANAALITSGNVQARNDDGSPAESHPAFEPHPMQGWTPDFIPKILQEAIDDKYYDDLITIPGPEGIAASKNLAKKEGIFTGITGGATFAVALKIAETAKPGTVILAMLPDTGERYLSSPLFEGDRKSVV